MTRHIAPSSSSSFGSLRAKAMPPLAAAAALAAALVAGVAPTAQAHDDATLDHQTSPHGGQVRMAGAQHFELVVVRDSPKVKANPIVVHVTDHGGTPVSTAGATASITLLSGTSKTKVTTELKPDGPNTLKGTAAYASSPDLKAVLTVTLTGQAPEQARFTPLAPH